jgi:hypothetical protein
MLRCESRWTHRTTIVFALWAIFLCLFEISSLAGGLSGNSNVPPTFSPRQLKMLSSGALMLLNQSNNLVRPSPKGRRSNISADPSVVAGLDARVGPNVLLGNDPAQLPTNMAAQAEAHIVRDPNVVDTLLATFQEGRFTNGGAVDCGYAVSHDGGLTWSRALIPGLTTIVGGPYPRASDPVAGIALDGAMYIATIGVVDAAQSMSAIAVSRSTNGGATFEAPVEALRSPDSSIFLDKEWLAVNTFSNTPTAGRLVITYTRFDRVNDTSPQARIYSDNGGISWSSSAFVTDDLTYTQGSQPVFLPDGRLAVVYFDYSFEDPIYAYIRVAVSTNGGDTFSYSNQVAKMLIYDPEDMRSASILPSATGNRSNNTLYVVYQGIYPLDLPGGPRILFTKSTDAGETWSLPRPVSDNSTNTGVFNATIAASPDGQTLTVSFYDGRMNPSNHFLVDVFMAQSFDGGETWQPNIRITPVSSDVRLAPLTPAGYMVGDYEGIAPTTGLDVPAVPVFIDTRMGNPDPFIARVGISSNLTFRAWRAARFSLTEINTPLLGDPMADLESDRINNALEYAFGLNPRVTDKPIYNLLGFVGGSFMASYQRLRATSDLTFTWLTSSNLVNWVPGLGITSTIATNINPRYEDVTVNLGPKVTTPGPQFYKLAVTLTP